MFDITSWIKDEVLEDHTITPIKINTIIKDFSEKFNIHISVQVLAVKKEES